MNISGVRIIKDEGIRISKKLLYLLSDSTFYA